MTFLLLLLIFDSGIAEKLSLFELTRNNQVVIVGETHRRPESARFITETVTEYLRKGKCLIVGLEIRSHQQPILERAFNNRASISSIQLSSIIDHPGYHRMLASFKDHIRKGECLKVHAIDAPAIVPVDRDEWMEKQILEMIDGTPILVLVGNFHALKEVKWYSKALGGPSLAQRLVRRKLQVASVLQYWSKEDCKLRREEVLSTSDPGTLEYVRKIMDAMNAYPPGKPSGVADAVVIWHCVD